MSTIVQQKKCFLISPIGPEDSEIRDQADLFREDIVRAAIGDRYEVKRADDYNRAGNITSQVIEAIVDADLIVADLTGRNANVYYELSVAHCYRKHVVPMRSIADETGDLPFDNYTERTIPYSLAKLGLRNKARELLSKAVEETVAQTPSNPVTTALGLKRAEQGGDNVATILTSLSAQVASLERRVSGRDRDVHILRLRTGQGKTMTLADYFSEIADKTSFIVGDPEQESKPGAQDAPDKQKK